MRCLLPLLLLPSLSFAQEKNAWVAESNKNADVLLQVMARYSPEEAGELGISGLDERISTPGLDRAERERRDEAEAVKVLQSRLASTTDPLIKQDLDIMIEAGQRDIHASDIYEHRTLPYLNVARLIFNGEQALLTPQIPENRRKAAVVRLRRYVGAESGYTPVTVLAEKLFRARVKDGSLLGPPKAEVEKDLSTMDSYRQGIEELLTKFKQTGYEDSLKKFSSQMAEYKAFVQKEVLPKARTDFRLPPDIYAVNLQNVGVDYTPAELEKLAHASFTEIQSQMQTLAAKIAKEHGFPSSDYRSVVAELKKQQLKPDQVMPEYRHTLDQIENIIRTQHLVTLPQRPCIIRIASAAETASQPAPHYRPPPLIGNTGQQGQFVLPGGTTGANGEDLKYDDFTFTAGSWTLTSHEARPGHDLQFAAMVDRGVSQARAIFAFNSTNVEGWALYAEWVMLPFMPDEGKLISLQLRLLRAARAFLDPELQEGKISPEAALTLLQKDVVLSKAFATEEVDRFTFRSPGQAVSYFDGYTRLTALRKEVNEQMGGRFNAQRFHDFILAQGLLPPKLLRQAVMTDFVKQQLSASN